MSRFLLLREPLVMALPAIVRDSPLASWERGRGRGGAAA
jgi:hypothetical protein